MRQYLHFGVILQLAQNLISLGCGQLFELIVDPAGILFDRVMNFQNRANRCTECGACIMYISFGRLLFFVAWKVKAKDKNMQRCYLSKDAGFVDCSDLLSSR